MCFSCSTKAMSLSTEPQCYQWQQTVRVELNQLSHDSTPLCGHPSQLVPCHSLLHCVVGWTETISINKFSFLANSGSCMVVYNYLGSHMTVQSCEQKVEFGVHHSAVLDVHRNKSLGLWVSIAIGTYRCTWLLMIHLAMLYTVIQVFQLSSHAACLYCVSTEDCSYCKAVGLFPLAQ